MQRGKPSDMRQKKFKLTGRPNTDNACVVVGVKAQAIDPPLSLCMCVCLSKLTVGHI